MVRAVQSKYKKRKSNHNETEQIFGNVFTNATTHKETTVHEPFRQTNKCLFRVQEDNKRRRKQRRGPCFVERRKQRNRQCFVESGRLLLFPCVSPHWLVHFLFYFVNLTSNCSAFHSFLQPYREQFLLNNNVIIMTIAIILLIAIIITILANNGNVLSGRPLMKQF